MKSEEGETACSTWHGRVLVKAGPVPEKYTTTVGMVETCKRHRHGR